MICSAWIEGVSTRKVDDLVKALGNESGISCSTVSRICKDIDEGVNTFLALVGARSISVSMQARWLRCVRITRVDDGGGAVVPCWGSGFADGSAILVLALTAYRVVAVVDRGAGDGLQADQESREGAASSYQPVWGDGLRSPCRGVLSVVRARPPPG